MVKCGASWGLVDEIDGEWVSGIAMTGLNRRFFGSYEVKMDAKKRAPIPAPLRDVIKCNFPDQQDRVMITVGPDDEPSIAVYPIQVYYENLERLEKPARINSDVRRLLRLMSNKAWECSLDGQGRIRLADPLIEFAGLEKTLAVCGSNTFMQIWDLERYNAMMDDSLADYSDLSKKANSVLAAMEE